MKCTKCGNEMREGYEQVGIDNSSNPINHKFAYCDKCMIKFDLDIMNNGQENAKKESICGIIGLICSFIFCNALFPIAGFILSIIGLCSKKKKSVCGTIGVIVSIFTVILSMLAPQFMKYVDEAKEESQISDSSEIRTVQQETEENLKDESEVQAENIIEIFGEEDIYFINSDFLYGNSEYYSDKNVITIIVVNETSRKTLYAKPIEDTEHSIYCEFENKKDIKELQEGDTVCVAGTVQSNQKAGKVVELENCHILAQNEECGYFLDKISEAENTQNEYVLSEKQNKIHEIVKMDDKYIDNFCYACESCGIDVFEIKDYQKLSNWESGERYSFSYMSNTHDVYLLDTGEIFSINYCQNTSIKLYERGYKPLNIEDFAIDVGTISILQVAAEAVVKESCNYPNSVNFDWWTTGSYLRIYDYYVLRAEFSAKNAFGMKERHSFRIDCTYSEETGSSLVYYELDGAAVFGSPQVPELPKEELEENNNPKDKDSIVLSYDKQGTNGQYDLFDGNPYLRYYVLPGNYTVKCNVSGGFYIETVKLHKEDGWDTSDIIQQINISAGDETEITLEDGQCISLMVNTEIELIEK